MRNSDLNYCGAENNCPNLNSNFSLFNPHTQQMTFVCAEHFSQSGNGVDIFKLIEPEAQPQPLATINYAQLEIFDYGSMPMSEAMELKSSAERIKLRLKRTAQDIIEIGQELIAAKEKCGHGQFEKWLIAEFDMSDRSAQRFIQVASAFNGKSDTVSVFNAKALYLLAAPSTPEEVRNKVLEDAENGIIRSSKEIEQLKRLSLDLEKKLNQQVDHAEALAEELRTAEQEIKDNKKLAQSVIDAKAAEAKAQAKLAAQTEIQKAQNEVKDLQAKIDKLKKDHAKEVDGKVSMKLNSVQCELNQKQWQIDSAEKRIAELKQQEKALDKKIGSQVRHEKAIDKLTDSFDGAFIAIFDIVDDKDFDFPASTELIDKWEKRQNSLQSLDKTIQVIIDSLKDSSEQIYKEEKIINAVTVKA